MPVTSPDTVSHKILRWFDANARELPWRNPPGAPLPLDDPDWPYRVWLSEIMLQQTTVAAVKPYFAGFTTRWPNVTALAAAEDADVMSAWAGLGYYARARNLLACARAVAASGGRFPEREDALRALPGVGAYTAAAIAAFAFGQRAVVVDGNIERVTARLHALSTPLPKAKPDIARHMDVMTPEARAGDFAQGLMDLAARICTPKDPKCLICPIAADCRGKDDPTAFPPKKAKTAKPEREGIVWWTTRGGDVFLVRRPDKGLLGGMRALPGSDWTARSPDFALPERTFGSITHGFTHFNLTLHIAPLAAAGDAEKSCVAQLVGEWWPLYRIEEAGLPTVFMKAVTRAQAATLTDTKDMREDAL